MFILYFASSSFQHRAIQLLSRRKKKKQKEHLFNARGPASGSHPARPPKPRLARPWARVSWRRQRCAPRGGKWRSFGGLQRVLPTFFVFVKVLPWLFGKTRTSIPFLWFLVFFPFGRTGCVFPKTSRGALPCGALGSNCRENLHGGACAKNLHRENLLRENLLRENLLRENLLRENLLRENLLRENLLRENLLRENLLRENLLRENSLRERLGNLLFI